MSSKHRSSRQSERATGAFEAPTAAQLAEGLIVDGSRGLYSVETPDGILRCSIRGRLRKELEFGSRGGAGREVKRVTVREHDPVAIGDRVRVLPTGGDSGVIEQIIARAGGAFTRRDPNAGEGNLSLTTIAGLDQLIAVFAAREPAPHLRLLDRLLVLAESQSIVALICLNKVDQQPDDWLLERLEVYRAMGYPVVMTSATTGAGVSELRGHLAGRTSAFVGPSGVGKSSLLNAVQPGLALRVSAIGETTHKGRHTTTGTRLVPLDSDERLYRGYRWHPRAGVGSSLACAISTPASASSRPILGSAASPIAPICTSQTAPSARLWRMARSMSNATRATASSSPRRARLQ